MVGNKAIARTDLDPNGFVFVEGARWKAVAADTDAPIAQGEAVVITGVKGLTLFVARKAPMPEPQPVDELPPPDVDAAGDARALPASDQRLERAVHELRRHLPDDVQQQHRDERREVEHPQSRHDAPDRLHDRLRDGVQNLHDGAVRIELKPARESPG